MKQLSAVARSKDALEVLVRKGFYLKPVRAFRFFEDGVYRFSLTPSGRSESTSSYILSFQTPHFDYVPGNRYELLTDDNYRIPVDIRFLGDTPEFEAKYRYDGPLGAFYQKKATSFYLFAPFADRVLLVLTPRGKSERTFEMTHDRETGVFSLTVEGNLDEAKYQFLVSLFGEVRLLNDPYALSLGANADGSYVIDPERVRRIPLHEESLPPFKDPEDAVIYETNVRDLTSRTGIPESGTYALAGTRGLVDGKEKPVGLDYLLSLGVTHVQFQPLQDFQTVDEENPKSSYNWGYDPMYWFAPEGSYARKPRDPYSRVLELRQMVSQYHQAGLRVVLDVVYNHLFSVDYSPLSWLVPNYYFRENGDHSLSNGSGCGNDFESRRYMARRLILDSLENAVTLYGFDGFRFDLMGILDVETLALAEKRLKARKPSLLLYGEGWDLYTALPGEEKGSLNNAAKLPGFGFFNDRFRDVVKGKTNDGELRVRGYVLGDTNYRDGFKHVLAGSARAYAFPPLFATPRQSINYVECHDNHTFYDQARIACPEDSERETRFRIRMAIVAILFSAGIPFFHAGQEFGQSKHGKGNTYDSGDLDNGIDYERRDRFENDVTFFRDAIRLRKKIRSLAGKEQDEAWKNMTFEDLPYGALRQNLAFSDFSVAILYNPTKQNFLYTFPDYATLLLNDSGDVSESDIYQQMVIVNALSVNVFRLPRKKE